MVDSLAGIDQSTLANLTIDPETHTVITIPLPRTFAVFFNQNKSVVLRDEAAREALNVAVDRERLIDAVLGGYGSPIITPIPPGFGVDADNELATSTETAFDEARAILRDGDWELNAETGIWEKEIDDVVTPLAFSISTVNNSLFQATAEFLRSEWQKLGVAVTVKQFEQSDLTQAIIRPRDYEALLFGTAVGRPLDYYSFWHSSQRNDPGLNVALYANITTDSILSEARTNSNTEERASALLRFVGEINKETPAVFLYSPKLLYVFPNEVTGANFTGLAEPDERFASVPDWHMRTESVWPFFNNE
jgi:peptide/nickel transport system substrate-binding protein